MALRQGDTILDTWTRRIGLRTLTMRREQDAWGESFCHEVNGVAIFAMGADYIPEDSLLPRVTPERTRALLVDAKAAHFNTIRVWGGGHYPSDAFYDICDELWLLVWQDCMFACGAYQLTPAFEANIRAEVRDNVRRLRHHASLALWCGNNEMEMFAAQGHWVSTPVQKSEYIRMYEYIIPDEIRKADPVTFYWPSSSSSGGGFDEPNSPDRGDVHYWDVWHGEKPFADYRNHFFRYASEFGFQAYPPPEDGRGLHHAGGSQRVFVCDGKASAQRVSQWQDHEIHRADLPVSKGFPVARLRIANAAGRCDSLRCGALAAQPGPLHGRDHLAA